jgi:23S rRNA (cytidine1920-2'-O)/16S rRNA (cytidine1409-2'-O)-methyltransferase
MPPAARSRLDDLLVRRQVLPDLKTAQAWIVAGDVLVDGRVCTKLGTPVSETAVVNLRRPLDRYVSRGGLKLEAALHRFPVTVAGAVVLDAGASTGGFTDCLLQHGAARVYAVDVGYGQLRGKLGSDPRVVSLERTNISDLRKDRFDPPLDLCVFDLSYLSSKKAIPVLTQLFAGPVNIIGLIKPLFEGVPQQAMADLEAIAPALLDVLESLIPQKLAARDVMASPLLGNRGAVEFLVWLGAGSFEVAPTVLCARAMADAAQVVLAGRHQSP